jgi:hypothetical protein
VIGIDIGKNSFHVVGHDHRGAIVLRQKWSRRQVETRLANLSPCLIGMEACVGAHHLSRKLQMLGHDTRLMPRKYVRPYSKGQKNDFRDAEVSSGSTASVSQYPRRVRLSPNSGAKADMGARRIRARSSHCCDPRSPADVALSSAPLHCENAMSEVYWGSMPWALTIGAATGPLMKSISARVASSDFEALLTPPANIM